MSRRAWILVLALAALPAVCWLALRAGADRSARDAPEPIVPQGGEGALEAGSSGTSAVSHRAPPTAASPAPASEAGRSADPAPNTSTDGLRKLSLAVVERGSRRALPGFALALEQGSTELALEADALGRIETPAAWTPAEVTLRHRPDPARAEFRASWRLEPWQVVPPLAQGEPLEIQAEAPELVLEADAILASGEPARGVPVTLVYGWRDRARGFHSEFVDRELTDANGRARFSVFAAEARASSVYLEARDDERALASAPLFLDPPLTAGPWRLPLVATGSVRVRAFDHAGEPLAAGKAVATCAETAEAAMSVAHASIEGGAALLEQLAPARHRVRVIDRATGDQRAVEVQVQSARETTAEVHFDDGNTALAVAGRVVDENDRPLEGVTVWFSAPGGIEAFDFTRADGAFEFWSAPAARVVVGTASDAASDDFDPPSVEAPFGTRELVLRRSAQPALRHLRFEVTDAGAGGPPIDGGGVHVWLGKPRAAGGWLWESLESGQAELDVKLRPGLRYAVRCRGYVEERGELVAPDDPAETWIVRAALRRGFARELVVADRRTGAPLAGARVRAIEGELAAVAGEDGVARLSAAEWPARLWVECAGYRERVVDPEDLALVTDRVELEPLDER